MTFTNEALGLILFIAFLIFTSVVVALESYEHRRNTYWFKRAEALDRELEKCKRELEEYKRDRS